MGGRQSRGTLATNLDGHRNHSPTSRNRISVNPNMYHRPLPEIPRSPSESVSTQFSALTLTSPGTPSRREPDGSRSEHVDATSLPRVVGVEHNYAHRRRRHHNGATSGSSLESLLLIRGLGR